MPKLVLGVSGSIAAYRAADLARDLMRAGFEVRVCLTDGATQFVTPVLFETLTGQPCLISTFDEPVRGRMAHIDWARWADVVLVAPATANTLTKLAFGHGDDMLTTLVLAFEGPLVLAPAMNPAMYANPDTQEALTRLRARAAVVVEPDEGDVACGEQGQGKLAANAAIQAAVEAVAGMRQSLAGKTVLITSGPTQEPIDDVRFLSNRSSGKMGAALARAALLMGARVIVVTGPASEPLPLRAEVFPVRTAEEMLTVAARFAPEADVIVGAAAVSDYRVANRVEGKRRRTAEPWPIELVPNPDVLAELARSTSESSVVVGFAAEPSADLEAARAKIAAKGLHAIAHNDVSQPGIGFESDDNELTLLFSDGRQVSSGVRSKLACAVWLFKQIGQT